MTMLSLSCFIPDLSVHQSSEGYESVPGDFRLLPALLSVRTFSFPDEWIFHLICRQGYLDRSYAPVQRALPRRMCVPETTNICPL